MPADTSKDMFPLSFKRKRLYIFPTVYGFLFLTILFVMLLGSINYNNNLGFMLVFLLGSITLVSIIHTYRNMLGIEILSASAAPVFAGNTVILRLLVRAHETHRRSIGFMVERPNYTIEEIEAKTDKHVSVKCLAKNRGIFSPDRLTVWSRYPMGLFRSWTVINPDISCVVYPKPIAGAFRFSGKSGDDDADGRTARRGVDDFAGLKQYQPGDPVSKIAWKSLSRGLGVFTKEFTGSGGRMVMLDYEAMDSGDIEYKVSRLTDMVIKAHNMNLEYGLLLPGRTIAPEKGEGHKHLCLKVLAMFGVKKLEAES